MEDWMKALDRAKPRKEALNYIRPGRHLFALVNYGTKDLDGGTMVTWKLLTLESPEHAPNEVCDNGAKLFGDTSYKREDGEMRAADFVRQLLGPENGTPQSARANWLMQPECPGRGMLIVAHAVQKPIKNPRPNQSPYFVDVRYEHVPNQTPEQIAKLRAHIESVAPSTALIQPRSAKYEAAVSTPAPWQTASVPPVYQAPVAAPVAPTAPPPASAVSVNLLNEILGRA